MEAVVLVGVDGVGHVGHVRTLEDGELVEHVFDVVEHDGVELGPAEACTLGALGGNFLNSPFLTGK